MPNFITKRAQFQRPANFGIKNSRKIKFKSPHWFPRPYPQKMPRKAKPVIKPASPELQRRWVKPTSINQYLYCSICTEIFRDPHRLSCGYPNSFLLLNLTPKQACFLQCVHYKLHKLKIGVPLRPHEDRFLCNAPRHLGFGHNRRDPSVLSLQKERLSPKHTPPANADPRADLQIQKNPKVPTKPSGQRLR